MELYLQLEPPWSSGRVGCFTVGGSLFDGGGDGGIGRRAMVVATMGVKRAERHTRGEGCSRRVRESNNNSAGGKDLNGMGGRRCNGAVQEEGSACSNVGEVLEKRQQRY